MDFECLGKLSAAVKRTFCDGKVSDKKAGEKKVAVAEGPR
jgi:hypothetical protein